MQNIEKNKKFEAVFNNFNVKNQVSSFIQQNKNKKICLYGAGLFASEFIEAYDLSELNILGVFDGNPDKKGTKFGNYKVLSLDEIEKINPDVIIVTVLEPKEIVLNLEFLKKVKGLNYKIETEIFVELKQTGERQVSKTLDNVEKRHKQRYNFASFFIDSYEKFFDKQVKMADIGCGIGYGSYIMATTLDEKLSDLNSFDISEEALAFAKNYYKHDKITFNHQNCLADKLALNKVFAENTFDAITCFEMLEHIEIEESKKLLSLLLTKSDVMISSFPIDNDSLHHKIKLSKQEIESYYQEAMENCSVPKEIAAAYIQNGKYYIFVIKNKAI